MAYWKNIDDAISDDDAIDGNIKVVINMEERLNGLVTLIIKLLSFLRMHALI